MFDRFVQRVVDFCIRNRVAVILVTAAITGLMAWAVLGLQIDSDVTNLLPRNLKVMELTEKYGRSKDSGELLLAVEADDPFGLDKLAALEQAVRRIQSRPEVTGAIHPFNMITFENEGGRLRMAPAGPGGWAPRTPAELALFRRRLAENPLARNLLVSRDGRQLCAVFPVKLAEQYEGLIAAVQEAVRPLKAYYQVYLTGAPIIMQTTRDALLSDVPKFLALSFLVILMVLFLSFRSWRSILLPLIVVSLGTLWTMGTMVLAGFKLTVVSIMAPPLVLTLGSSYSIHVLNQYYRQAQHAGSKQWIARAVSLVNATVFLAALTTIIGFGSLGTATLRQIREFGIATSAGIFYCMLLAELFLPAMLSFGRNPSRVEQERVLSGAIARAMRRLAAWVIRWRYAVLAVVVLIAAGFGLALRHVQYQTNYLAYYRKSEKIIRDSRAVVRSFGGYTNIFLTLEAPGGRKNYFLDPEVLARVARFEEAVAVDPDVSYVFSFTTLLRMMNRALTGQNSVPNRRAPILLASRYVRAIAASPYGSSLEVLPANQDFSRLNFAIRVFDSQTGSVILEPRMRQLLKRLDRLAAENLAGLPRPQLWGRSMVLLYISETLARDQVWSAAASILLIFLVTALGFRSARLGAITLIPLLVGIMLNFVFMILLRIPFDVVTVMFSSVAMGVGIDDSIHLILWYRRQLKECPDPADRPRALAGTLVIAGRPIVLTSLTIVAGLAVLMFSRFMPILYFGMLVSLALSATTLGALVILPAVLSLEFGKKAGMRKSTSPTAGPPAPARSRSR
jgi:hydrophobe/amphiphile efflux-3 (HAE3) family protein